MMRVPGWSRHAAVGLVLLGVVVLGAALRFHRLDEMEYKEDEQWTYEHAVGVPQRQPWPMVGMRSSIGLPNPALSVLLFVGLAQAGSVATPVDLAARVVALNAAALALVFVFAGTLVAANEREAWWWGGSLAAVSPFAVFLQRKIWAQSALPLFSVLFLIGWWRRDRRWGALLWGFLSACLGQIHMSGLFFAAAFVLWARSGEPRRKVPRRTRWRWFAGGFLAGAVGLAIWFVEVGLALTSWLATKLALMPLPTFDPPRLRLASVLDVHILSLWPSYWVNWFSDAAGFGLDYSLGPHYWAFLKGPVVFGRSSWLALVATVASVVIAMMAAAPWTLSLIHDLRAGRWRERISRLGETGCAEGAAIGAFGLLLTATLLRMHRHYLIIAYPLQWVWLSRLILRRSRGRALLATLWIAQLVVTLSYLGYIHAHQGAEGGDYGRGYRWQESRVIEPGIGPLARQATVNLASMPWVDVRRKALRGVTMPGQWPPPPSLRRDQHERSVSCWLHEEIFCLSTVAPDTVKP